ncbi:helix-turn-helix domain-containing protein (plasmid) [Latilactobacillus sp. 5-91]|uniref:helix-turn-helix domain-containing protein n=1 Tax=Latilactobacillus sp. 5-91 TaxID=3410924 RepID=UPI003C780FD9
MENNLKQFRELKNISQEDVAKKMYVTRQTISRWENDHTIPPANALKELSTIYNVSIAQLLGEPVYISKKKINILALLGAISFNLFFGIIIYFFMFSGLFIGWFFSLTCLFSPIILFVVNIFGVQAFDWHQTTYALIALLIGIPLSICMFLISKYIFSFSISYIKFNLNSIFYEINVKKEID